MADRTFAKFSFFKIDPAWRRRDRRASRRRQAGVPRRLRGLRHRPLAARLLNHRHARRRRPGSAQPEPQPRRLHTFHVVLGQSGLAKWAETPYSFLSMTKPSPYSEERARTRDLRLRAQVPLPLPDGQAAPLVRTGAGGAGADHEKPHRGRPPLPRDLDQHDLLLRARRPGVRRLLRGRRPRRIPRPGQRAATRPSRASTPSWRRRSSPAWRCRWARHSTRSTERRGAVAGTESLPAASRF